MAQTILYIHGQGGSPEEAGHYRAHFKDYDVKGFAYTAQTPWEAKDEFPRLFEALCGRKQTVTLIANSIGAFFAMTALPEERIERAYFISPLVDMEQVIRDRLAWMQVSEETLRKKGVMATPFGQDLSWDYLSYVREHPLTWHVPTHILYGGKDTLTSFETMSAFAAQTGATLMVMEEGEHWFHTEEQMRFLDAWLDAVS